MTLWIVIVCLGGSLLALLLVPFLRHPEESNTDGHNFDIAVYKDQLSEVDRDYERGLLTEEEAETVRLEIQRRLLSAYDGVEVLTEKKPQRSFLVVTLIVFVPLVSGVLYSLLGSPETPGFPYAERTDTNAVSSAMPNLDDMVAGLEARLATSPDDPEGWAMLGRTYLVTERYRDSARAFDKLYELTGDIGARSAYAEAMIMANDTIISAEISAILGEVLRVSPLDPKARFYTGVGAAQEGDTVEAAQIWTDLVYLSPPDAEWLPIVHQQIASAATAAGISPTDLTPTPEAQALAAEMGLDSPQPSLIAPATPGPSAEDIENAAAMSEEDQQEMIRSMVQRLADRLEESPDDPEGWQRLIQSYEVLGETDKANAARLAAQPYLP